MPKIPISIVASTPPDDQTTADPAEAVDTYLADRFHIGLEAVLLDATLERPRVRIADVGVAVSETENLVCQGGGVEKRFAGSVKILGVRYDVEYRVFIDVDGYRFVTDIGRFAPAEWQARLGFGA